jgi:hypothetical protein
MTIAAPHSGLGHYDEELGFDAAIGAQGKAKSHDRLATGLLCCQIIGATFLQKIAIPIGGDRQIYLGLFVMLGLTAVGVLMRRLTLQPLRLGLFLVMAGGMILTQFLGAHSFSELSLPLLLIVHAPYIFCLKPGLSRPGAELTFFRNVMTVLAVAGIIQYAAQFAIGGHYAFYLDSELPRQFIFQGFNGLNPQSYGAHIYKSNGIVFLEPSIFCQCLAVGVIIEMLYFGSWQRLLLYLAALSVTFSGTGLIILAVLVPVFLARQHRYVLLSLILLAVVTGGLWAPVMGLGNFVSRINEFSSTDTSGYARFISIFRIIHDDILPEADTLFFGMGAGSIKAIAAQVNYAVHDPSWGKIIFEYGLIGALSYFPFMICVFVTSPRIFYVKAALALQFLFLGEYILSPTVHGLILALLAWPDAELPANKIHLPDDGKRVRGRKMKPDGLSNGKGYVACTKPPSSF